jgi:taurine dioxygenase
MTAAAGLRVTLLGGYIGAQIDGVDLADPSDAEVAAIAEVLYERHVVFFRAQDLSDDEHFALAGRFGPVTSESSAVSPDARFQFVEDTGDNPPHTDEWHTDMSCWERPPALALLSGRVIPPSGGDTIWVDLCAIHDALSPTMQAFVAGLHLRHYVGPNFRAAVAQNIVATSQADYAVVRAQLDERYEAVTAVHPLVRTHPVTGRPALFLSPRFAQSIVELTPHESAGLLGMLDTHLDDPNFQVRWRWAPNDLAIWDEAATNHRALADHFHLGPQHRLMRRCTVEGGVPFFDPAPVLSHAAR